MKTALETLKELRSKIAKDSGQTYDEYKTEYLNTLQKEFEEYINKKLIEQIELRPENNCWYVSIILKAKYKQVFCNYIEVLNFINDTVKFPEGFNLKVPLSIQQSPTIGHRYIRLVLEETL